MIVKSGHIDGFGIFADTGIPNFSEKLSLFVGDNEAGKTTLLAFFRAMLFGLPDKRTKRNRYEPLRGGKHGGRLVIRHGSEGELILDRAMESRDEPSIRYPNGSTGQETDLERLLAGASRDLYENIFAFGHKELADLDALGADEVRGRIQGAGMAGGGITVTEAIKVVEKRMGELFKSRGSTPKLNDLFSKLFEINKEVKEEHRNMGQYAGQVAEKESVEEKIISLEDELRIHEERKTHFERLRDIFDEWWTVQDAERQITEMIDLSAVQLEENRAADDGKSNGLRCAAFFLSLSPQVDALLAEQKSFIDARKDLPDLKNTERRISESLARLGAGWDEEKVQTQDTSIQCKDQIRTFESELKEAEEKLQITESSAREAERRLKEAQTVLKRREDDLNQSPKPAEADREKLHEKARALRNAQSLLQNRDHFTTKREDLIREQDETKEELGELEQETQQVSGFPKWIGWAVAFGGIVSVGASLWLGSNEGFVFGTVISGIGVLLTYFSARSARLESPTKTTRRDKINRKSHEASLQQEQIDSSIADINDQLERISLQLEIDLEDEDIDWETAFREIEETKESLQEWRQHKRRFEEAKEGADRAKRDSKESTGNLERAREALKTLEGQWDDWLGSHGLDRGMSPGTAREVIAEVEKARVEIGHKDETLERIEKMNHTVRNFTTRVRDLSQACGVQERGDSIEQFKRLEELLKVGRKMQNAESSLAKRGWKGEKRRELQKELSQTNIETLESNVRTDSDELEEVRKKLGHLKEELGRLSGSIERLETSDRLSQTLVRRSSVQAKLHGSAREWAVLALCRAALEEAVARYERERQPGVIREASKFFSAITGDHYKSIVTTLDGKDLHVIREDETRLSPMQLSQGTQEQLYLSMRFGLIREYTSHQEPLPVIMDDILINFDPSRASAAAKAIARLSENHQVLFFTCHPETADFLQKAEPGASVYQIRDGAVLT